MWSELQDESGTKRDVLVAWLGRIWPLGVAVRLIAAGAAVLVLGLGAAPSILVEAVRESEAARLAGDHAAALDAARRASRYHLWDSARLVALARAQIEAGDYAGAGSTLAHLAEQRALTAEEMAWWGPVYAAQGREADAIAAWEAAWVTGVIDAQGSEALARAYLTAGDEPRARAALEELARLGGADADLLVELALLQAHDAPDQAILTLAQAAALDREGAHRLAPLLQALDGTEDEPPDLRANRLGVAFLQMGEPELAERAFERAVGYNPVYGQALAYLAYTRVRLGKPALGAAELAAALSPDDPTVHYLAGQTWKRANRPVEARLAFARALDLDRANPAYAVEIASTHRMEGQLATAALWMQEAVRLAGGDTRFRLLLAQFYIDDEYRVQEEGLPLALALVEEAPDSAEAHATLGWAYFLLGRVGDAFEEIDRALALNPDLPRANLHKAALLESQGRLDEAVSYYQRAAALDPDGPSGAFARRALERIGVP
jgi:tetratricopeptide (TPR) repeat protein